MTEDEDDRFWWDHKNETYQEDPPLTPVHRRYLEELDSWLRIGDDHRPTRMANLVALMRHDVVKEQDEEESCGSVSGDPSDRGVGVRDDRSGEWKQYLDARDDENRVTRSTK